MFVYQGIENRQEFFPEKVNLNSFSKSVKRRDPAHNCSLLNGVCKIWLLNMALKTPASHVIIAQHNPEVVILFGNAAGSEVQENRTVILPLQTY